MGSDRGREAEDIGQVESLEREDDALERKGHAKRHGNAQRQCRREYSDVHPERHGGLDAQRRKRTPQCNVYSLLWSQDRFSALATGSDLARVNP